ncbi:hypothetical protein FC093_22650 [Ilyomonas limi]|uniref:Uncharacterized protein n=1 Tax=Ilyomonas limi TaxID=2575867 RepID=A0A4U3KTN8_9BACT|nr:hypothetical protein [Ilyomonas limi]TKK64357.1 hypothetical protein FC093_22650 [Ilyomonas limi]
MIKYIFILTTIISGCANKSSDIKLQGSIDTLIQVVHQNDLSILYNVSIKPREYSIESEKQIVRFQVRLNKKTFSIPVFDGDIPFSKGNYFDLFAYYQLKNIHNRDSAIIQGKDYSDRVMGLYRVLKVHEILGGLPNVGELVIFKLLDGSQILFIPDTSKIFNNKWKESVYLSSKKIDKNLYIINK